MAPIVPGQFANGLLPPPPQGQQPQQLFNQQNLAVPQQAAPGAQGLGPGWEGVVPAVDRAPEQYGGFWGPEGEWMPWPNYPLQPPAGDGRAEGTQQHAETGAPVTPTAASASATSSEGDNLEAPRPSATSAPANESARSAGTDNTSTQTEGGVSARQAAALAAMRRSQSSGAVPSRPNSALQEISTSTASAADSSSNSPTNDGKAGSSSTNASQSSTTATANQSSNTNTRSPSSALSTLPRLIPLYDTTLPSIRVSQAPFFPDSQREQAARRTHIRGRVLDYMAANPGPSSSSSSSSASPWTGNASSSMVHNVFRSGELPEQLSDAQLAALDVLTRDAIDERLRVLESVSARTTMCVEELLRVRSVLPSLPNTRRQDADAAAVRPDNGSGSDGDTSSGAATTVPEAQAEVPPLP